jgi:hypothetical protein
MKNKTDTTATILNAIITGTNKVNFALPDHPDAAYMARVMFTGFIDYAEWKPGTERPVAVGNDMVLVRGFSEGEQESEHDMVAHTTMRHRGHAHGVTRMDGSASGTGGGTGQYSGQVLSAPVMLLSPNAPNASMPQVILSENVGSSSMQSQFQQTNRVLGTSDVVIQGEGEADTVARGTSRGRTRTDSVTESFVTRYEWMPSQLYSSQEQMERLTGEIMNLDHREVFVKHVH